MSKENVIELRPYAGLITVKAKDLNEALAKIRAALNDHDDIDCDWIEGQELENKD